jgi:hypothetical protein
VILQDRLIVYGGVDRFSRYLNEVQEFNFGAKRWQCVDTTYSKELGNMGIAGHRMEAVFENTKIYNRLT